MEEVLFVSQDSMHPKYADKLKDALDIFKWQLPKSDTVIKAPDTVSGLYNIITYKEYCELDPDYYRFRTIHKRWYIIFDSFVDFHLALKELKPTKPYEWSRFNDDTNRGYDVTSKGDRRFSPLFMRYNGISLEEYYHLDLKGYRSLGYTNWMDVKGLPPIDTNNFDLKIHKMYSSYLFNYPGLIYELALIGLTDPFTDIFDVMGGQNKIYSTFLNNYFSLI